MTKLEFRNVLMVIAKLWPKHAKEMNDEQANVWWMRLNKYSGDAAVSALRGHAAHSKWMPKPNEIADRIGKERTVSSEPVPEAGKWDSQKELWAQAAPHRRDEIMAWDDIKCDLAFSRWSFIKSVELYGPASGYAIRAWSLFQQALKNNGAMVAPDPDYERDGGRKEAESIYQSHLGGNHVRTLPKDRPRDLSGGGVKQERQECVGDSPFHPDEIPGANDRRGDPPVSDDRRMPPDSRQVETREADAVPDEPHHIKGKEADVPW